MPTDIKISHFLLNFSLVRERIDILDFLYLCKKVNAGLTNVESYFNIPMYHGSRTVEHTKTYSYVQLMFYLLQIGR